MTGHSSSTHDSSRQSGGIGSGSTGLGSSTTGRSGLDSGLGSGSGSNTRDSATLGGSGLGSGTTGTGLSSGVGPGTTGHHAGLESASRSAGDRGLDSSNTDSALGSATGSGNRSGLTGTGGPVDATSSRTGGGVSGGHGGVGSSLTSSSGGGMGTTASGLNEGHEKLTGDRSHNISGATATLSDNQRAGGATHGIPERAEHDLASAVDGRGASELGGAGATSGATGGHHTARGELTTFLEAVSVDQGLTSIFLFSHRRHPEGALRDSRTRWCRNWYHWH